MNEKPQPSREEKREPEGELKMPLIPLGWDSQASALMAACLCAFCPWVGRHCPMQPLSPTELSHSIKQSQKHRDGNHLCPSILSSSVGIGCCFGAEAEGPSLCALGHHRDAGNCHTCRLTDTGKGNCGGEGSTGKWHSGSPAHARQG